MNIPTAEEFLQNSLTISHFHSDKYGKMCYLSDEMQKAMVEFTKLHVEEFRKEVLINTKTDVTDACGDIRSYLIEKRILESYPLNNIK